MEVIQTIKYKMTKEDYAFIKPQLRAKKLRLRMIGEKAGMNGHTIGEQLRGKDRLSFKVLEVLKENDIVIPLTSIKVVEE